MKDLFIAGGAGFMSILSILLVIMVAWMAYHMTKYLSTQKPDSDYTLRKVEQGRAIGLFALVTGILGQLIGLYAAFAFISTISDIDPAILSNGLKVSMITTLYGMIIYLISIALWFGARQLIDKRS